MSERTRAAYWRSLGALAGARGGPGRSDEFPPGASEPPAGLSRREMLRLLGVTASLAGLAGCRRPVERILPYVDPPEGIVPGIPQVYATTMPLGVDSYGILVESHEGRPTKIEGNELHPSSLGGTTAWIQAAIYGLYDPDRSRSVLKAGVKASWEDFVSRWKSLEAEHLSDGGRRLAVLSEPFSSPTLARLARAFEERFPAARFVCWEPASRENLLSGLERAFGRPVRPVYHLEHARVLVALDSDLLVSDPDSIRHARGFASGRTLRSPAGEMNRLYVVESDLSPTGVVADERLRLRSGQIGAFLLALAAELGRNGLPLEEAGSLPQEIGPRIGVPGSFLGSLARDLLAHRGSSLLVAGFEQPPEVHAAVAVLNEALENSDRTVTYHELLDARPGQTADLSSLVSSLRAGEIETLVLLGGNPAYDAPADLDFAGAMNKARETIHLSLYADETSERASWHLPMAHFLESWSDARAADGTLSVLQPLIEPLHGGRSAVELLGLLASGEPKRGRDLVRETWRGILGEAGFEERWRKLLEEGVLRGSASPSVRLALRQGSLEDLARRAGPEAASGAGRIEAVFRVSRSVHDGRFANIAWLQELPEPVTKIVWGNAALFSHGTARALGLETGDVVRLERGGRSVEAPAFVLAGMADSVVSLPLGYGRRKAGRIGSGVGFDAYSLRTSDAPWIAGDVRIEKTGRRERLVTTQEHWLMEGRPIVLEATLEDYREDPRFAQEAVEHPPLRSLYPDRDYSRSPQWGMVVDLNACVGCNACVVACQSENNIPVVGKDQVGRNREMHWIRVDRYYAGDPSEPDEARSVFQPVMCQHCENAPCEEVCPVGATVHDSEGLNVMVYNRCIGTRYCSNNCPYKVRRFNFYNFTRDTPELLKIAQNPEVTVRSRGVMEKCTYCLQRIREAELRAKAEGRPLRDGEPKTACQQACPAGAIFFGDIANPDSSVSKLKKLDRNYAVLAELNNRPRTSYLARIRNPNPRTGRAQG